MPFKFICATIALQSLSPVVAAGAGVLTAGALGTGALLAGALTGAARAATGVVLGALLRIGVGAALGACVASDKPNASIRNSTISKPPRTSGASSRSRLPTIAI